MDREANRNTTMGLLMFQLTLVLQKFIKTMNIIKYIMLKKANDLIWFWQEQENQDVIHIL